MKLLKQALTFLASTSALAAALPASAAAPQPDVILRNGAVYLVEPQGRWAEAVAIQGGKIVAVGSDAEVDRLKGPATKVYDLGKRMVMPGLVDVHVHVGMAAEELQTYTCTFSSYADLDAVIAAVRACATGKKPGEWIVGENWGSALYGQLASADAIRRLDEASGDHPVLLRNDTIHDRWANSRALALAGIRQDTPDPQNGKIGHDPKTGALNGLLLEAAGRLVEAHVPVMTAKKTLAGQADALGSGVRYLNSKGVTGFDDALVGATPVGFSSNVPAYRLLEQQGGLTARVALSMLVDPDKPDFAALYADREAVRSPRLSMDFAKIFIDGVMVSHTAVFVEPYLRDAEHGADFHGTSKMTQERLNQLVTELDRRGVSVKMHVAGDGAVHMALDAIAAARKANGNGGPIHTLAHAGYILPSDIPRVRALHAAIDASPTVWFPGPILAGTEAVIGKERANRFWPFKTFVQQGVLVAGGTDWKTLPGEFSDLWDGMQGMVTRRNPAGTAPGALWPEQAVDVATMLRFYTLNSAEAIRMNDRIGSVTVGKAADLIVLDQNLFRIPADRIAATKVDLTFFDGKLVYQRQ